MDKLKECLLHSYGREDKKVDLLYKKKLLLTNLFFIFEMGGVRGSEIVFACVSK